MLQAISVGILHNAVIVGSIVHRVPFKPRQNFLFIVSLVFISLIINMDASAVRAIMITAEAAARGTVIVPRQQCYSGGVLVLHKSKGMNRTP